MAKRGRILEGIKEDTNLNKDNVLINNGLEKNLGNEEIIIDGYKINKEALKVIKSLNPHHKALMFTLLDIQKL